MFVSMTFYGLLVPQNSSRLFIRVLTIYVNCNDELLNKFLGKIFLPTVF
jgi:hypothetical protein